MRVFGREISRRRKQSNADVTSLFSGLFGQGFAPTFSALGSDYMQSDAYASAIQTNASYCSKFIFEVVRNTPEGTQVRDYPTLERLLQVRPNRLMSASVFWETVATHHYHFNNAFVYVERDAFDNILALWPINPGKVSFAKIETGEILVSFTMNGGRHDIPYSRIVHVPRNVTGEDLLFGVQNTAIKRVIELINTNYQGLENAIVMSAFIRFIGTYATVLNEESLRKKAEEFTNRYLRLNNDQQQVGIIFNDSTFDLKPIQTNQQRTANYAEMRQFDEWVYRFFGCPESVILGKATEQEMASYYERTPSVFAERVVQELTEKLLSPGEYAAGNRIKFADRRLQYYSMATRIQVFHEAREMGIFDYGTLGDLLGLPVHGDLRNKICVSQNYQGGEITPNPSDKTDNNKTDKEDNVDE